jgi:hypothetical protein
MTDANVLFGRITDGSGIQVKGKVFPSTGLGDP